MAAVALVAVALAAAIVWRAGADGSPTMTVAGLLAPTAVHVDDETNSGTGVRVVWTGQSDGRRSRSCTCTATDVPRPEVTKPIPAGQTEATITVDATVPYCFVVATVVPGSPVTYMNAPFCIRGASAVIVVPTS